MTFDEATAYEVFLWIAVAVWRDKSPELVHKKNDAERVRLDAKASEILRRYDHLDFLEAYQALAQDPDQTQLNLERAILRIATDAAYATWRSLSDASEAVLRAKGLDDRYPATEVDAWLLTHLRPSGATMTWCQTCRALVLIVDRLQQVCTAGHYVTTKWRVWTEFKEPGVASKDYPDPETAS